MADMWYPVFFECLIPLEEQSKKIERYFRIQRKSGGGDCGAVTNVKENVYKIAFRHQKDQQAVLQRSEHVVDLPGGPVAFTVRASLDPPSPTAPAEDPAPGPASPLPSPEEEYELHLDQYLLRYLRECPMAEREVEEKLATVACSAQLHPEEGRVLVRRPAQPLGEGRNWRAEVDNVFDGYLCHTEVNPHKVAALLQSCSSPESTDEVRVYGEAGIAVVVGERSQVHARLMEIEDRLNSSGGDSASYYLQGGVQVLVCQGDITKLYADALVNAANEDLDHCDGVAAALSKAGGPEVQRESKALVEYSGKINTGEVVVTTGGNLNCKKLLHAVGPVAGKPRGKERVLLEKTVQNALNLAAMMEFKSIAMPCISSGVFGVPLDVCSEAIVTAVKEFGSQGGRSLSKIILIDNTSEVVRAMQAACDRLLQGRSTACSTPSHLRLNVGAVGQDAPRGATAGAPGGFVHVEIVKGTIETQEVDALVSPMVGHDLLSTRIGSTLHEIVGSQLTTRFKEEAEDETFPSDSVLVEGLPGLPSKAVFFLNLFPWNDQNGNYDDQTAVQVLRAGINNILTSCVNRGFGSVALPVLGTGIALRFPDDVAVMVLLVEIGAFVSRTPLLVRIVVHPNDEESYQVIQFIQETLKNQQDQASTTKRIVVLGKTGSGKSNLANTILGEEIFATYHSPNSGTTACEAKTKSINGRSITLIDTPGLFDTGRSEKDINQEIVSCITECAPGPHAFLIVLRVDKYTEQEEDVIKKICDYFSEDALNYAVIVFTHGNQLPKKMKIEEFVKKNKNLSDLVDRCGGRCHVFDNKYWDCQQQQNNYRSNQFQVEELLKTIDKMVAENNGRWYSNETIQDVEKKIQIEEEVIRHSSGNLSPQEIRNQAKAKVSNRFLIQLAGTATGVLLGAFFGLEIMVRKVITAANPRQFVNLGKKALGAAAGDVALVATGVMAGAAAVAGAAVGGTIGHDVAQDSLSPVEAVQQTYRAVMDQKNQISHIFS